MLSMMLHYLFLKGWREKLNFKKQAVGGQVELKGQGKNSMRKYTEDHKAVEPPGN